MANEGFSPRHGLWLTRVHKAVCCESMIGKNALGKLQSGLIPSMPADSELHQVTQVRHATLKSMLSASEQRQACAYNSPCMFRLACCARSCEAPPPAASEGLTTRSGNDPSSSTSIARLAVGQSGRYVPSCSPDRMHGQTGSLNCRELPAKQLHKPVSS